MKPMNKTGSCVHDFYWYRVGTSCDASTPPAIPTLWLHLREQYALLYSDSNKENVTNTFTSSSILFSYNQKKVFFQPTPPVCDVMHMYPNLAINRTAVWSFLFKCSGIGRSGRWLMTSRRCSLNQSASLRPVSPIYNTRGHLVLNKPLPHFLLSLRQTWEDLR